MNFDRSKLEQMVEISRELEQYPPVELDIPEHDYTIVPADNRLNEIIDKYDVLVVAGAFFGDEGKGKTVDALARRIPMVGRFNSGQNAGHTVMVGNKEYIFHLCPSGIMVPTAENFIGSECVMDPFSFFDEEIVPLLEAGDHVDRLHIDNVHITTPYHKLMDLLRNLPQDVAKIPEDELILNNASTLQGIAPVHMSKVNKTGPRLNDIIYGGLKTAIERDIALYDGMLRTREIDDKKLLSIVGKINEKRKRIPDYVVNFLDARDKIAYLVEIFQKGVRDNPDFPRVQDTRQMIGSRMDTGEKLLIEASQSFYLSNRIHNFWSSATSPDTTAFGVAADAGINFGRYRVGAINVHKAPGSSRVGRGENPAGLTWQTFYSDHGIDSLDELGTLCDDYNNIQKQFFKSISGNGHLLQTTYTDASGTELPISVAMAIATAKRFGERGATTKKPRVTGDFDCVLHRKVMEEQGPYTTISALDRADDLDGFPLVIGYRYHHPEQKEMVSMGVTYQNGKTIMPGDSIPDSKVLAYCHPIYKVFPGWSSEPIAADRWNGRLPEGVTRALSAIEHLTGAKIISIGNGPKAENLIYLK